MAKLVLKNGKWFQTEWAEQYDEKLIFEPEEDGTQIHKCLYYTKKGTWVRKIWETVGGEVTSERCEVIDSKKAADWFYMEGYKSEEIPEYVFQPDNEV